MRAFFAVDLPESVVDPLTAVQVDLDDAAGLRVTDPTQAHVTLKFLGKIDAGDGHTDTPALDDILTAGQRAVDRADIAPFDCSIAGLGVFPSFEYISVVWAGIEDGTEELTALHEALETETTSLGVDAETRDFTPHVTLARMSDARGKNLVQETVRERHPEFGRFEVDAIRLVASTLTAEGPVYDTVETFALG